MTIKASPAQLERAFEKWEQEYRDDPSGFMSDIEHASQTPKTYGELCTAYLIKLLAGQPDKWA
jgi:hypothetical protein